MRPLERLRAAVRRPAPRSGAGTRSRHTLMLAAALLAPAAAPAQVSVSFVDFAGNPNAAFYAPLTAHTLAAASQWIGTLSGVAPGASIEVQIEFTNTIPRATGRSATSGYVTTVGGFDLWAQGMMHELVTGLDVNGAVPDVEIQMNPDYLANNLWFDPDPALRTAPIPVLRTDAFSVMLHEIAHAMVFNGWRDGMTGTLPGSYRSTFDQWVDGVGGGLFFTGPAAMAVYGGPVPITLGNYAHVGNAGDGPLLDDLMNGIVFNFQQRYDIGPLDLAILADAATVRPAAVVPEPATAVLLATVLVPGTALFARRRRRSNVSR